MTEISSEGLNDVGGPMTRFEICESKGMRFIVGNADTGGIIRPDGGIILPVPESEFYEGSAKRLVEFINELLEARSRL